MKQAWAEQAGDVLIELMDLSEESLSEASSTAIEAHDKWMALLRAMSSPQAIKRLKSADPLAPAFLRGMVAQRRLIKETGGVLTTDQAAELLGITPQAVNKLRASCKLLALTLRKRGYMYPRWQFGERGDLIPGLDEILLNLRDHDEWMQNAFFISPNIRLNDRRPLDLLREGRFDEVTEVAKSFGEHGAA